MARSLVGRLSFMKGISLVTDLEAPVKHRLKGSSGDVN